MNRLSENITEKNQGLTSYICQYTIINGSTSLCVFNGKNNQKQTALWLELINQLVSQVVSQKATSRRKRAIRGGFGDSISYSRARLGLNLKGCRIQHINPRRRPLSDRFIRRNARGLKTSGFFSY